MALKRRLRPETDRSLGISAGLWTRLDKVFFYPVEFGLTEFY
jgi:hypothetical protein